MDKVIINQSTLVTPFHHSAGGPAAILHHLTVPNQIAMLACQLALAEMGSEKVSPNVGAARYYCTMAEALYAEFKERGWLIELPDPTKQQADRLPIDPQED